MYGIMGAISVPLTNPFTDPPHCAGTRTAFGLDFLSEEVTVVVRRITHPYTSRNNALRTSLDDPLLQKREGRREGKCRSIGCWLAL